MKKIGFLLIISLYCCTPPPQSQSFKSDFMAALDEKTMDKAERILKAWKKADATSADLYVAYFNFFTVKSMDAATKKGTDQFDAVYSKKALEYISEGIRRYPSRFDMRIAKIYMLGQLGDYKTYVEDVIKMIVTSKEIQNNWKGEDFVTIGKPEEMFFGAILDFQEFLYRKNDEARYKDMFRISDEMLKHYPTHVQARINNSTVYVTKKEYEKALDELQKGLAIEPQSAVLLYNMGIVYSQQGDTENARTYYTLAIANCNDRDGRLKESAQKRLEALN